MRIESAGFNNIINHISRLYAATGGASGRAMYRVGALVKGVAQKYAPISPTQTQLNALRKTKRKRKSRATSRPKPGALQNSITFKATESYADIFVPASSPAGKYAARIHDGKGSLWHKRGPGTIAKGPQADAKFISRAITDSEEEIYKIMHSELQKIIRG